MQLFSELLRRRVFHAAALYAAAAWLAVEILSFLLERMGAPDDALNWLAVLFIAGFPVAMIGAWFFDLSTEGLRRTRSPAPVGRLAAVLAVGLLSVATVALSYLLLSAPKQVPPEVGREFSPSPNSVAVLPFMNLSEEAGSEYFSDGLSDTLIDRLANIAGLVVIARTSSFSFKGRNIDVRSIGRQLEVAALVEGSVQRAGDRLRVIAQLVRTSDGAHLWSETFDRGLDDVFLIQDEIAERIAAELSEQLAPASRAAGPTTSAGAFDLYLLGRHHMHQRTEADLRRAIALLEQAIELDRNYAPAYSGLADACLLLLDYSNAAREEVLPRAEEAIASALALDDELAEAHASLGLLHKSRGEYVEAERSLRRAIDLNGNYSMAFMWLAITLDDQGRYEDARPLHVQARALDPLSFQVNNRMALNSWLRGDLPGARSLYEAAINIEPGHANGYWGLALVAWSRGRMDEAVALYAEALKRDPDRATFHGQLAAVYLDFGKADKAVEWSASAWQLAPRFAWLAYLRGLSLVSQGEEADARRFALQQAAGRSEDPYMLSAVASVLMIAGYQTDAAAQSEQVNTLVNDDELLTGPWDIIYGVCHDAARAALLATSGAPESARNLATRLRDYVESLQALGLGLPQANYCLAQAHAILGNAGAAFETLESSLAGGWPRCWFLRRDPAFVTLRERPEFVAIADGCGR